MLTLTRRDGEALVINRNVVVIARRCRKGRCELSVCAPPAVEVHRAEILKPSDIDPETVKILIGETDGK